MGFTTILITPVLGFCIIKKVDHSSRDGLYHYFDCICLVFPQSIKWTTAVSTGYVGGICMAFLYFKKWTTTPSMGCVGVYMSGECTPGAVKYLYCTRTRLSRSGLLQLRQHLDLPVFYHVLGFRKGPTCWTIWFEKPVNGAILTYKPRHCRVTLYDHGFSKTRKKFFSTNTLEFRVKRCPSR